jgi:exodeoxyribonuclease V alpha subunit
MADKHTVIQEGELLLGVGRLLKVDRDEAERALELAEGDQAVARLGEDRWQALGPWVMETYLRDRLAAMVAAEQVPSGHLFWATPSDTKVDELLAEFQAENSLKLTEEQKQAVWMALTQRVGMILGGAGTGKTTVLKAIMWAVEKLQGTVHAVALAGRAAIRMTEATGRPARTIAGFLGASERGDLELGGSDLVVVDEASMVDLPLAYSLMRAIPEDARLLMVGDPYQLPPIGMGLVFSVYAEDDRIPKVELMQVHRQARETGIPQIAGQIRTGTMPGLKPYEGARAGISFLPCTSAEAQAQVIELVSELAGPGEVQILSPIKNGPAGIKTINAALHRLRTVGRDEWQGYAVDDPVIWLENDYDRKIWNGTLGAVQAAGSTSLSVLWDGHDKLMDMGLSDLDSLNLAYAISVHKAQGSQFRRVIVPVFKSRLLDRTLIYTALTRATEQVVFLGDADALRQAVEAQPAAHRRNHGLSVAPGPSAI